ncbi:MAG: DNA mismatch repair protein MutS, partial [Clostridia bacterium]|nr:DNA mismatch repair protein MutS [Clostridia bacterium]
MANKKTIGLSPMMEHYQQLKQKYSDAILMYRLGDFYEMFFEDAKTASKVLDLTLTGRDCGLEERAPMCGVPYHAVDNYISRLVSAGYKVAICEQLSNPGDQKGLVKRDVIRVITAGTNTDDENMDAGKNHFLCGVGLYEDTYAVALLDVTTGEFSVKEFPNEDFSSVEDYLLAVTPSEIIAPTFICDLSRTLPSVSSERIVRFSKYYDYAFDFDTAAKNLKNHYGVFALDAIGLQNNPSSVCACGGVIDYLLNTQKRSLRHIAIPKILTDKDVLFLDYNAIRNLELTESQPDNKKVGTLLWVLDETNTGMGARLLRNWILHPLCSKAAIEERQKGVGELLKNTALRVSVCSNLAQIKDLERYVTKIAYYKIMPRDCLGLADSLRVIPTLKIALSKLNSPIFHELNDLLDA